MADDRKRLLPQALQRTRHIDSLPLSITLGIQSKPNTELTGDGKSKKKAGRQALCKSTPAKIASLSSSVIHCQPRGTEALSGHCWNLDAASTASIGQVCSHFLITSTSQYSYTVPGSTTNTMECSCCSNLTFSKLRLIWQSSEQERSVYK